MNCGAPLSTPLPAETSGFDLRTAALYAYTPRHLADQILSARGQIEGERKQVTVMFCDLVDSTGLSERLGPEAMHELLNSFFALALGEVHRFEGTVARLQGDGFLALFGAPIAHEDHARRGVLAGLAIQHRLAQAADDQRGSLDVMAGSIGHAVRGVHDVRCRVGLNTGLVVVGSIGDNLEMEYTAIGDTANVAARLEALAAPGTVLISQATARLVDGQFRLESLGAIPLKGRVVPVDTYRVVSVGPRRSTFEGVLARSLGPFVGRQRELAALEHLVTLVEAGQGQVVGITGEPGMGKSRLLYELQRALAGRHFTYLEGRCLSYGSLVPYVPLLDIVRANCRIAEDDVPELIGLKVDLALREVGVDPAQSGPYMLNLLGVHEGTESLAGLSAEAVKVRTFDALSRWTVLGSRKRPIILAIEDLHWIDRTSEQFLSALADDLAGNRILLLCTYRPGYRPPWVERSYATQISVPRLNPEDSLQVVSAVTAVETARAKVVAAILDRAEGNPFFLEELGRVLLDRGDRALEAAVPETIQSVLMARIDRLSDEPRRLLQTASVLGRTFSLRLLDAIWPGGTAREPQLLELKRLEFLYEPPGIEEPAYIFKHALTQEVAYESLLVSRRKVLHEAAGQALEALYADRLDEVSDRLAYHYARTENATKAVAYLRRFAEKAARGYAHAEAVTALQQAVARAAQLPAEAQDRRILELVIRLAHSLYFLGRFQEAHDLLLAEQDRLARLDDPMVAGPYLFWLAFVCGLLGQRERAERIARQALDAATRAGDEGTQGTAHFCLAMVAGYYAGRFGQGIEHGQRAVVLLERADERWWLGMAHWLVGFNHALMGTFQLALVAESQAHAVGEAIGDPRLQCFAAWTTGYVQAISGDALAAIQTCRRSLEHSPDPLNSAVALGFLGAAYLEAGDAGQATHILEQAVQRYGHFRLRHFQGWFMALLGEAYLLAGQIERAGKVALEGLGITRDIEFWYGHGLAQRALGRIHRASGDLEEAESYLGAALQTFTTIQARFQMGRTQFGLADLASARGDEVAAASYREAADRAFEVSGDISRLESPV